jgi:3-hydroxyacyl-[acyl-carrier-protein] dehydratase
MNNDLSLPQPAERFIPHRAAMRLIDTLISRSETTGVIDATPGADCLLVAADGFLDEAALVELMAQGYAAIRGYDDLVQGREISEGYLVGVRKFRVAARARAGQRLLVRIRTVGSFEAFAVAEGEIERDGETIACGTIKLWIDAPVPAARESA